MIYLSLGIPVYNQVDSIVSTLQSVLNQTVPFDEIVISDNHSTDGTSELLKKFSKQVRIIKPPEHLGMAQNWNFCIENLQGEWFSLLSGDDLLKPQFAAEIKKAITSNPQAVLIRTDWEVIDAHGHVNSIHNQLSVSTITTPPKTWKEQLKGPKTSFAAFAARRQSWAQVGGFSTDFHLFQDWMFWLKLAPLGSFIRIPQLLAQYRNHERPALELGRIALRIEDEYRYMMNILPNLPWNANSDKKKIKRIRRERLNALLNYLINYPQIFKEQLYTTKLTTIAEASGFDNFERWLLNPQVIAPSWYSKELAHIKLLLRKLFVSIRKA